MSVIPSTSGDFHDDQEYVEAVWLSGLEGAPPPSPTAFAKGTTRSSGMSVIPSTSGDFHDDQEYVEAVWLSGLEGAPPPSPTAFAKKPQGNGQAQLHRKSLLEKFEDTRTQRHKKKLPSSSSAKRSRYVTPEDKVKRKPATREDSPLSPRWEKARRALCSPSLRREQEEAARAIFEKAASTVGLSESARDKATRAKMNGYECPCCSPYYDALGLTAEERKKRVNQVSRHRGFRQMPRTPPRYWDVHFPSIEEQKALGLFVVCDTPLFTTSTKPDRSLQ